jgi:hypothetical protein
MNAVVGGWIVVLTLLMIVMAVILGIYLPEIGQLKNRQNRLSSRVNTLATTQTQPSAYLMRTNSGDAEIPTDVSTVLQFDTLVVQKGDITYDAGHWTVSRAGLYIVCINTLFLAPPEVPITFIVFNETKNLEVAWLRLLPTPDDPSFLGDNGTLTSVVQANAGDVFVISAQQFSGGDVTVFAGNASFTLLVPFV